MSQIIKIDVDMKKVLEHISRIDVNAVYAIHALEHAGGSKAEAIDALAELLDELDKLKKHLTAVIDSE